MELHFSDSKLMLYVHLCLHTALLGVMLNCTADCLFTVPSVYIAYAFCNIVL